MNRKCMPCAAKLGTFCGYLEREIDENENSSNPPCESAPRNYYR